MYPSAHELNNLEQQNIQLSLQQLEIDNQPEGQEKKSKICKISQQIKKNNFSLKYDRLFALGGMLSGGICLFSGILALFTIQRLGRQAGKSAKQLHANFSKVSKKMRLIFLVLPTSLILSFSCSLFIFTGGERTIHIIGALVICIGLFISDLNRNLTKHDNEISELKGILVTPETNPRIWKIVTQIAHKLEINTIPNNIVLCIGGGIRVSEKETYLYPEEIQLNGYTLYLDSTYINYFTLPELCSVIAHELNHIANNDLTLSEDISQQVNKLIGTITTLSDSKILFPAYLLSNYFYYSFSKAIRKWNYSLIYKGDLQAIKVIPKEHLALAISKIYLLRTQIDQALKNYSYKAYSTDLPLDYVNQYVSQTQTPLLRQLLEKPSSACQAQPSLARRLSCIKYRELNHLSGLLVSISPTTLLRDLFNHELNELQTAYKVYVPKKAEENINQLKNIANQHQKIITIKQGGIIRLILRILIASIFIIITYAFYKGISNDADRLKAVITFSAFSLYFLYRCYIMYRYIGSVLLTLKPQGLALPCFDKIIPWEQISLYYVKSNYHTQLELFLSPNYQIGKIKPCYADIIYNPQKKHIKITAYEIRGKIKLADCFQLITEYKEIAEARRELQQYSQ